MGLVLFVSFTNWTAQTVFTHNFVALVHCGSRFVQGQAPLSLRRSTPEMLVPLKCVLGVLILGSVLSVFSRYISFALHRAILVSVGWSNSSFYSAALHFPRCHQFCVKRPDCNWRLCACSENRSDQRLCELSRWSVRIQWL